LVVGGTNYFKLSLFGFTLTIPITLTTAEVINLANSASTCKNFPDFPSAVTSGIGYYGYGNYLSVCQPSTGTCYAIRQGGWAQQSSMKEKRFYSGFAISKDLRSLYVSGGSSDGSSASNTMEYSSSGVWYYVSTTIPVPIKHHCMVRLNSTLILVGGLTGFNSQSESVSSQTYFFNLSTRVL
jgi:hypothetical protein